MKMRRQRAGINSFRGDGWISYRYGYMDIDIIYVYIWIYGYGYGNGYGYHDYSGKGGDDKDGENLYEEGLLAKYYIL